MITVVNRLHAMFRMVACLVAATVFLCASAYAAPAAHVIDYLHVEANEGDSSGGHTAIRFDRQTFHFQHESPGIIRIRRLDSAAFNHLYGKLGNRTIRESTVAVSAETCTLLLDALTRLLLIQDAQLALRDELGRDISLFEQLVGRVSNASLPVKGAGYFVAHGESADEADSGSSRELATLRDRVTARYGERFITERIARIREHIRSTVVRAADPPIAGISRAVYPAYPAIVSTGYSDGLAALAALEILQTAAPLRHGVLLTSETKLFRLDPGETQLLKRFADQQTDDLVRLIDSSRPDWGGAFMAGMARLVAVHASIAAGRLLFPDLFPAMRNEAAPQRDQDPRNFLSALTNERREAFLHWRREFFQSGPVREADYAALERAGNLLIDSEQACATDRTPRSPPEEPFPAREALRVAPPLPERDETVLLRELATARMAAANYDAALGRLYAYNLVRRNCVTEIFAMINDALAQHALTDGRTPGTAEGTAVSESINRLGGYIDAARGLTFIPFVSAGVVAASYTVVATHERPSYRRERLAAMATHESPLLLFLRESNTLTSTIYHPTPDDSPFLFFTDDTVMLRPLFGACNLLVGLGESLLGVATAPFTGTDRLVAGLRGMLFSLPELAFVNLRKGSMAYLDLERGEE